MAPPPLWSVIGAIINISLIDNLSEFHLVINVIDHFGVTHNDPQIENASDSRYNS